MKKDYVVPAVAFICIIALLLHEPIPQDQNYHQFADTRAIFGVRNFWNVITNLPFGIIALMGLTAVRNIEDKEAKKIFYVLFMGFFLLTFGSGYYHLWPNNDTLVYDRLPMVLLFMSFFSLMIYDYINRRRGYLAFIILNIIGIATVIYWIVSEHNGEGDLRWYGMVQFFPIIAIVLILILYKSPFNYKKEIILIFLFFGLAKLCERFDGQIYSWLSNTISGHSLKHIFVALAEYQIVVLVRRRINQMRLLKRVAD